MTKPSARRGTLVLAAVAALLVAAFAAVPAAQASTLYACVTKGGTVHVFAKKPKKCKAKEKLISWNSGGTKGASGTNGTNGASGTNGTNGTNGAAGQPQKAVKFSGSEESSFSPTPIKLFSADGINYTFTCQFLLIADDTEVQAGGAVGQSYGLGNFGRPSGEETKSEDLKSSINVTKLGAEALTIASTPNAAENKEKSIEQYGIWTVTVEGPTSMTWIHLWTDTASTCKVHGTAITVPD